MQYSLSNKQTGKTSQSTTKKKKILGDIHSCVNLSIINGNNNDNETKLKKIGSDYFFLTTTHTHTHLNEFNDIETSSNNNDNVNILKKSVQTVKPLSTRLGLVPATKQKPKTKKKLFHVYQISKKCVCVGVSKKEKQNH